MGWLSFQMNEPVKEWFKRQYSDITNVQVLDVAIVKRNTLYAAIKDIHTNEIYAVVYLLRWSRERGYNFSYKSMSEFSGPCESECPKRILSLLTPLNDTEDSDGFAREWRKRCWDTIYNRKKLNSGNYVIKTNEPLTFTNGLRYQYFKKIGKGMFAGIIENNMFNPSSKVRLNVNYLNYEMISIV